MKERTRYQASWGDWYVQVQYPTGEIVELKFDHEPKPEMVDKQAQVIADSMAVEKAKPAPAPLAEAVPEEVSKISEFAKTAPADEVKPIPADPIRR